LLCVCAGVTALHKALSSDGVPLSAVPLSAVPLSAVVPTQTFPATLTLQTRYRRLAVVVDVGCAEGVMFVTQVSYCLRVSSNFVDSS